MSAEPDNSKIEELLKAYAKKRREEMSAPIELHPAVRKMLQGEVAKQRPAPPQERKGFFSVFLQFWPRFAVAGAAVLLLSLVLVNINQHPNPGEAKQMARAADELLKEQVKASGPARDNRAPAAPANGPAVEALDLDGISGEKNVKDVRLQRELKLAKNERAPMPTEGASAKKPMDGSGLERSKRGEVKLADEFTVARESLDTKAAPKPEVRLSLAGGAAKTDADRDSYATRRVAGLAVVANPAPALHPAPTTAPVRARPEPPAAQSEPRPLPTQILSDQPARRTDFGVNGNAIADPSPASRGRYYALPPLSSSAATNAVAFTQPSSAPAATSANLLAYDTSKQLNLFARSSLELDSQPAPEAWSYGYFESVQNGPVVSARFANVNQQTKSLVEDKTEALAKKSEQWGEGAQARPLSATFNVQQNGGRIRIVDFDGSIYDGRVLQRANAVDTEKQKAARQLGVLSESEKLAELGDNIEQSQVAFTVSGTNRTLKKLIVVNGTLLGDAPQAGGIAGKERAYRGLIEGAQAGTELRAAVQPPKNALGAKGVAPTNQLPVQVWTANLIKGSVRFDSTNELKIEARRVSQ